MNGPRREPSGGRVHVLGAGLAGLAAALSLSAAGHTAIIHEATGQAGGRCRSWYDAKLGCRIDNGNHLMLSANRGLLAYLAEIGGRDGLAEIAPAAFAFVDVLSGERWALRPNRGPLPWWILAPSRRVPGTRLRDYLEGRRLFGAGPGDTVADRLTPGTMLWRRFWEPLSLGILNCAPHEGQARLLARVCRLSFMRGEAMSRPLYARHSLSETLIDPALAVMQQRGVAIHFHQRIREIERLGAGAGTGDEGGDEGGDEDGAGSREGDRVRALVTNAGRIALGRRDQVISALPSWSLAALLPEQPAPTGARMILNLHYRLPPSSGTPPRTPGPGTGPAPITGLIGGVAQWLFVKDGVASVTVSAADALVARPAADLAAQIWREISLALNMQAAPMPVWRMVKEKRATFHATPDNEARRPATRTRWRNLFLAGDWTDTGLPATLEGAIQSGRDAAQAALQQVGAETYDAVGGGGRDA